MADVGFIAERYLRRVPCQARSRRMVERLLEAAEQVLSTEGVTGFNTNRVAEEAGVGVGSLYEYFVDKESLARALADRIADRFAVELLGRFGGLKTTGVRRLLAIGVRATFETYRDNRELYFAARSVADQAWTVGHRQGEQKVLAAFVALIRTLPAESLPADPEMAAFTCFNMIESLSERMTADGAPGADDDARIHQIEVAVARYLGLT